MVRACEVRTISFTEISENELLILMEFSGCSSNERKEIIEQRVDDYFDSKGMGVRYLVIWWCTLTLIDIVECQI